MVRSFFDPSLLKQMMPKQGFSSTPVFDLSVLMDTHRKNMQALSDLVQLNVENAQNAASRQAEFMGQMMQDYSTYASSILTEGTPEQKMQRHADIVRKSYETTVEGAKEVSDLLNKSNEEAADIIHRRVSATLAEIKAAFDPKSLINGDQEGSSGDSKKSAAAARRKAA